MNGTLEDNPVKRAIKERRTVFGMYIGMPSPTVIELAAIAGVDWVRIDWVHSPLDLSMIENMIRAAENHEIAPFVRLELNEQKITSVLEAGALGVIVPNVETAEDAQALVNAIKFSPLGKRGIFSVPRKSKFGLINGSEFKKWTNEQVMIGVQIESLTAVENLEEILKVMGIDIVLSGKGDLSNALNVTDQKYHHSVLEMEEKIFKLARKKGIAISPQVDPTFSNFEEQLTKWKSKNAEVISLGYDLSIIKNAFENIINKS